MSNSTASQLQHSSSALQSEPGSAHSLIASGRSSSACSSALYLLYSIKVISQWEKVALLRLGHYVGLRGPGIFFIVPVLETLSRFVDQRVRVTSVTAESTLTRDTVPVDVDAIIFWLVWNAEKAILEVENFSKPSP